MVRLVGELDLATGADLVPVLGALTVDAAPAVVIEARELTFIDSRGLFVLLDFARVQRGGDVVVVPSDAVRRVIQLIALDGVLHLVDSMAEALEYVDGLTPD